MSRRTGKAATRRARQQKRTRQGPSPAAAAAVPPSATEQSPAQDMATVAPTPAAVAPRTTAPAYATGTSSRLGESARLEYHYVVSDLRNTGILILIMAGLLAVAVVAVNLISAAP